MEKYFKLIRFHETKFSSVKWVYERLAGFF